MYIYMNEDKKILKVALDVPIDQLFDYLNNGSVNSLGQYVKISFGNRILTGVVCGFEKKSSLVNSKLKQIISADKEIICDENLLKLLKFSANYYHHPIGQTILSVVPLRIKQDKNKIFLKELAYRATQDLSSDWISNIARRQRTKRKIAEILLKGVIRQTALKNIASNAPQVIDELVSIGICHVEEWVPAIKEHTDKIPILNDQQVHIIKKLNECKKFVPWLLYGVTGSGKTEIYLNLIDSYLKIKKAQILVLVPEINLTPQLESRFRIRFPNKNLAILHSNLNPSERLNNWRNSKSGEAQIVLGTRLAIFTPIKNLKLIIIDEEHDISFKQQDGFKYHARDIALVRARNENIPIIMGTATPSLESWLNATGQVPKYKLLKLDKRAVPNASLPSINIIPKSDNKHPISSLIIKAIQTRIRRNEQSLVFINRRGYAPVLACASCGWTASCHRCSSKLVVHLNKKRMKCHYCDYDRSIYVQCEACGNTDLHPVGVGTQKIENHLKELLPSASIVRVDRDNMRKKNALNELFDKIHLGKVDILVGTQMLSKGHDFPKLTLVVVLDADNALYSIDLRASERLFSQLMQVSGRAGRANLKGEVLIETNFPKHPIFQAVKSHNYEDFANNLLNERKLLLLPPYAFNAVLKAESTKIELVEKFTNDIAEWGDTISPEVNIFGPVRPPIERIKGYERVNIHIQSVKRNHIQNMLKIWINQIRKHPSANRIKWSIDIDPM